MEAELMNVIEIQMIHDLSVGAGFKGCMASFINGPTSIHPAILSHHNVSDRCVKYSFFFPDFPIKIYKFVILIPEF